MTAPVWWSSTPIRIIRLLPAGRGGTCRWRKFPPARTFAKPTPTTPRTWTNGKQNMQVRIGINPLTWSNDDLPSLGAGNSLEMCLREARLAGYDGVELGNKFPRDAAVLGPILAAHQLQLVSGWYSARLL